MEPFLITCTTCKRQLRVRSREAIGQILACPKCGSMVLVELPTDGAETTTSPPPSSAGPSTKSKAPVVAPGPAPADASGTTPEVPHEGAPRTPATPHSTSSHSAPSHSAPSPPAAPKPVAETPPSAKPDVPAEVATTPPAKPVGESPPPPPTALEDLPTEAGSITDEPLLPGDQWMSPAAQRWQQGVLLLASGVLGIALAIGAVVILVAWNSGDSSSTTRTPTAAPESVASTTPVDLTSVAGAAEPPIAREGNSPALPEPPTEDENESAAEAATASTPPAQDVPSTSPDRAGSSEGRTEDRTEEAPPGLVPQGTAVAESGKPGDFVDNLQRLAPFLDHQPFTATAPQEGSGRGSPTEQAASEKLPRPEPPKIDLAARLADPIAAVELQGMPLADVLRLISQLSTIPITLDVDSLDTTRVTPLSPIDVELRQTSIAGLLDTVLRPYELDYLTSGQQLVVHSDRNQFRVVEHDLSALVGDDTTAAAALMQLIRQAIEPHSWRETGGKGQLSLTGLKLRVEQNDAAQQLIRDLLEKLKVARSGAGNGSALRPRAQAASERLAQPVTINYVEPTPLPQILERLESMSGVKILVDWEAASEIGWWPNALRKVTAHQQPLEDVLRQLLEPMELTVRVLDENLMQVTTTAQLQEVVEVELYRVDDLLPGSSGPRLVEQLQQRLAQFGLGRNGALFYDPPSRSVVAVLPPPAQLQVIAALERARDRAE